MIIGPPALSDSEYMNYGNVSLIKTVLSFSFFIKSFQVVEWTF